MNTPITNAVRRICDRLFWNSQYAETFEAVDDNYDYPNVTYFNEKGDALRINHLTERITFFPKSGLRMVRIFGDVYEQGKSGIRIIRKAKLFHVYTTGRFGPERHVGFVIARNAGCIQETTYVTFNISNSLCIPKDFFTNPLGIGNLNEYRKWKKLHRSERS